MPDRRDFIKGLTAGGAMLAARRIVEASVMSATVKEAGEDAAAEATVYRALNGGPAANLAKTVELMGGVERLIEADAVVVVKPNVQWWNQGAPNLAALRRFVDLVMNRPGGFRGEVVLAENCHRGPRPWTSPSSGWARRFERNCDLPGVADYNDLAALLKKRYGDRFSLRHWINLDAGGRRVSGPAEGPGYVFCDGTRGVPLEEFDNGLSGAGYRAVIMTYPILRTDRGTLVDFRRGVWEEGGYTERPVRFVNFAALNHHSAYCGATSAVKNFLGVADLSGGPDPFDGGKLTDRHYNFHSFPFDKWAPGPRPGMIGAEIGVFMERIRRPDLNITTAEWVGLASRTDPPAARTGAVLASTDAVALDFHATKYLLYANSRIKYHDPERPDSPQHQYLRECARRGGGVFDESRVAVRSHDFKTGRTLAAGEDPTVRGAFVRGSDLRTILKYYALRGGLV